MTGSRQIFGGKCECFYTNKKCDSLDYITAANSKRVVFCKAHMSLAKNMNAVNRQK